jgi:hypothetical protein
MGHNKIISDKVRKYCHEYLYHMGVALRAVVRSVTDEGGAGCVGSDRLDRQGSSAWADWADQSWWAAEAAHETGTVSGFPVPQLVGAFVRRRTRT